MFKKWVVFFFFGLLVLFFIVDDAGATIYIEKVSCTETGFVEVDLKYYCGLDKCAHNQKRGFSTISFIASSKFRNNSLTFKNPPARLAEKEGSYRLFTNASIPSYLSYTLIVNDTEMVSAYQFNCPDVNFLCAAINLSIDACDRDKFRFYFLFHGLGDQFSSEELASEIDYYVNPANTYLGEVSTFSYDLGEKPIQSHTVSPDIEVKEAGADLYLLTAPVMGLKDRVMKSIYIEVKDCDKSKFDTADLLKCDNLFCEGNKDCPDGTECAGNYCRILHCGACEKAEGHKCVSMCKSRHICEAAFCVKDSCSYRGLPGCCIQDSDCNDGLVCTEDSCKDNQCVNSPLNCSAANSCVVGECREPDGCIYSQEDSLLCVTSITGGAVAGAFKNNNGAKAALALLLLLVCLLFSYIRATKT